MLPPFAAKGTFDIFKTLLGEFDGREEFAREAAAEILGEAVGHLADTHHAGGGHLLIVLPEVAVFLGLERLWDECAAFHGKKNLPVLRHDGLPLFNVGKEVFGGFASVAHVCAEKAVPVVEHIEEVVLGNGLLVEKVEEGCLMREALVALRHELLLLGRVREIVDVRQTTVSFATWSFGVLEIWSFSRIFS